MNKFYDKKLIIRCLLTFAGLLVLMRATAGVGFVAILPFVLVSLTRNQPEKFLFYILLMISMVVVNPMIVPRGGIFFVEQRAMFALLGLLLMLRVAGQRSSPIVKPFMLMVAYIFFMVVPSINGWCRVVSLLKLFLFTVIYFALYETANSAAINPKSAIVPIRSVVIAVAIPFILGSVLLIFYPAIGMMSYEEMMMSANPGVSLFRGFTNHAQCLGPVIACLGTLLFADLLFGVGKPDKLYLVLLLCCPILIWKTSSRTALATMVAGIAFVMYFFMHARRVNRRWKSKIFSAMLMIVAFGAIALVFSGAGEGVKRFIAKRDAIEGEKVVLSSESLLSSRMGLAEDQMANFKKKPLTGNGFQVSEALQYMDTSHWTHLLSAPVEKGVWVTAILEEGGVIGLVLFLLFLGTVFSTLIRYKAYVSASTLFVFIVVNFGEFTIFSMSYSGGFCWAIVFAALVLDSVRSREERKDLNRAYIRFG